jgi:hypothetical protein
MFALRNRLRDELHLSVTEGLTFGYGVVTPDADLPDAAAEWAPEMILDAPKIARRGELGAGLKELIGYWQKKTRSARPVSPASLQKITDFLRPDFDRVRSLRFRADEIYAEMERLTEEQYQRLDLIEASPRVLIAGGAGTGKSFLAAEIARREAAAGSSVVLTCRSSLLASFLGSRLRNGQIDVLPLEAALGSSKAPYDVLIVDEAQDFCDVDTLVRVSTLVKSGLEEGRWRFFYDANNQKSLLGTFDEDALEYLCELAVAGGTLHHNCRNTVEIVLQTRLLTGADLGNPTAGHGPGVEYAYFEQAEQEAALLEAHIRWLYDEDVAPGEITILSPLDREHSCLAHLRPKWRERIRTVDARAAAEWPLSETTFAEIPAFKGLENQFIALVDIGGPNDELHRTLIYVAMSRARTGLWIALHQDLRVQLEAVSKEHLDDVVDGAARV